MKTQRSADFASSFFIILLSLVVLYASTQITGGMEERLPPRTLPYILGFTLLVSGILLVVKTWRYRGADPAIKWPGRSGLVKVAVTVVSLGVYIVLIGPLGMPISTAIFVAFLVWYLWYGSHAVLYGIITGIISGAVVYYLFIQLLELSFPLGPLQR